MIRALAQVAELVYARDSKSRSLGIVGSSPTLGTILRISEECRVVAENEDWQKHMLLL